MEGLVAKLPLPTSTTTRVPFPGVDSTRMRPPTDSARLRIVIIPQPCGASPAGSKPTPSSVMIKCALASACSSFSVTVLALACLATFVSASCAIRNSTLSTSGASRGSEFFSLEQRRDVGALGKSLAVPTERGQESIVVEHRRVQFAHHVAGALDRFPHESERVVQASGRRRYFRQLIADDIQVDVQRSEVLSYAVVQFARQLPPFALCDSIQAYGQRTHLIVRLAQFLLRPLALGDVAKQNGNLPVFRLVDPAGVDIEPTVQLLGPLYKANRFAR